MPSEAAVRRMSKSELVDYGATLGLNFDPDEMTRDDMIDQILAAR